MNHKISAQALTARLTDLVLPFGITINRVDIDLGATELQTSPLKLSPQTEAAIEAEISAGNIAKFLEKKAPGGLSKFKVSIKDGLVYVEAKAKMLVEIPVKAVCSLVLVDGSEVHAKLKSAEVMGGGASGLVEGMMDKVNPIMNTADFPMPVLLRELEAGDDRVIIRGNVLPPEDLT